MIWLKLIRFPNLLIVAITQLFLYYYILLPYATDQASPNLAILHFGLLTIATMLIAACGYVVNDIVDVPIDQINKPDDIFIGRLISKRSAWVYFWILFALGATISMYLAIYIDDLKLFTLFPLAVLLLALYSYKFKREGLIGNIVVGIFCMFVAGIVLFAERQYTYDLLNFNPVNTQFIYRSFIAYMVFGLLSTIYREIVKDIEDIDGDKKLNYNTLPIRVGVPRSKIIATFYCAFLLVLIAGFLLIYSTASIVGVILLICISGILLYSILLLHKANVSDDYHRVSTIIKVSMALGILVIPFL